MTKVRAYKNVSQKKSPRVTFHAPRSAKEGEGMNLTFSRELPLWELESWWTPELSEGNCRG
jgi:hypothetical protein